MAIGTSKTTPGETGTTETRELVPIAAGNVTHSGGLEGGSLAPLGNLGFKKEANVTTAADKKQTVELTSNDDYPRSLLQGRHRNVTPLD
jgi:hypothetical protein